MQFWTTLQEKWKVMRNYVLRWGRPGLRLSAQIGVSCGWLVIVAVWSPIVIVNPWLSIGSKVTRSVGCLVWIQRTWTALPRFIHIPPGCLKDGLLNWAYQKQSNSWFGTTGRNNEDLLAHVSLRWILMLIPVVLLQTSTLQHKAYSFVQRFLERSPSSSWEVRSWSCMFCILTRWVPTH